MVLTINPAGSGSRRRWLRNIISFSAGIVGGAIASLALVTLVFALIDIGLGDAVLPGLSVGVISMGLLHEFGVPVPIPYRREQVPEWWREALPPGVAAWGYGSVLGFGFLTPFTSSTHLAFLFLLPFVNSGPGVIVSLGLFVVGKSAVLALGRGTASLDEVRHRLSSIDLSSSRRRFARTAASSAVAVLSLTTLAPLF